MKAFRSRPVSFSLMQKRSPLPLCPVDPATGSMGAFFGSRQSHIPQARLQSSCLDLAVFQKSPDSLQLEIVFGEHNPSPWVLGTLSCPRFWAFLLGNTNKIYL